MENLEEIQKAAEQKVKDVATNTATEVATKAVEPLNKSVEDLKAELANKSTELDNINKKAEEAIETANKASAAVNKAGQIKGGQEVQNIELEQVIKHAILSNKEDINNAYANATAVGKSVNLEEVKKDITNASWASGALARSTDRVRTNLYANPYAPIWLKNLFPQTTTDGGAIIVPQVNAYSGGVAVWTRGTGQGGADVAKPDVNVTFKDITVTPVWLAGKMRVNRELLMNVSYLASSIPQTLLYSPVGLYAAENKMITDYLSTNAVPYAGTKTIGIEMIVDAAFGQMLGGYLQADYVFLNNYDYVEFIALNKASGSGEYDLPNGLEVSVINGSLFINQLQAIPVPSIAQGTAYVVDSSQFEFLTRMGAELRMFEQSQDDAEKNKVLFRIEEMATFFTKNLNAAVKIEFPEPEPETPPAG